jgi:hypothetical protein
MLVVYKLYYLWLLLVRERSPSCGFIIGQNLDAVPQIVFLLFFSQEEIIFLERFADTLQNW